mgnify:CR=1 FL=1
MYKYMYVYILYPWGQREPLLGVTTSGALLAARKYVDVVYQQWYMSDPSTEQSSWL